MILGTYANLNAIDVKRSGAHLASDFSKVPDIQQTPNIIRRITEEPIITKTQNLSIVLLPPKNSEENKRSPVSPQPEPEVPKILTQKVEEKKADEEHKKLDEQKDIELKKTKDELKLTKQLLEKKTGQLREAQDLVVGKLGEVVEKVEEIAKEIKEDKEEEVKVVKEVPKVEEILLKVQEIKKTIELEKSSNNTARIPKDSLMNRLTKNGSKNVLEKAEIVEVEKKVEENLISPDGKKEADEKEVEDIKKIDEAVGKKLKVVIEDVKVKPVPLAVLINSSKVEVPKVKEDQPPQVIVKNETVIKEEENANIEAIRRDLLEEKQSEDPPSKVKRSVTYSQEDCPKKPSTKHNDET